MAQSRNINIIPNSAITRVHVSQGDIGRTIYFNLYEGSIAYTPTSGDVIKCVGTKPSGLGFTVNCTWSGNVVTCVTTEEMTDESGSIDAELVITSSDESTVLGTSNFKLCIEKNPHPSNTTDGTQTTAQSLQVQIDNLDTRVTTLESDTSGGLTTAIKNALLDCFANVAWTTSSGQDYYDALYDALYEVTAITLNSTSLTLNTIGGTSQLTATTTPSGANVTWSSSNTSIATVSSSGLVTSVAYGSCTITATAGSVSATCSVVVAQATVTSINAVYTQSGTVYDNASLSDLTSDLVVTATWSDSTTSTVSSSDYTLSGTLSAGTSTITVSYGGYTDTFDVTVTAQYQIYDYITNTTTSTSEYVDTGLTYSPSFASLKCEFKVANTNDDSNGDGFLGWRYSSTTNVKNWIFYARATRLGISGFMLGTTARAEDTSGVEGPVVVTYTFVDGGASYLSYDSYTYEIATVTSSSLGMPTTLVLAGCYNGSGKYGISNSRCKLGYVKFTDPDTSTLLYDFEPCADVINNTVGFYDTVNDIYYPSNGSDFTVGNWS